MPDRPSALERRAALHAALGDPHRLAIVEALQLSDRSPSDLADELGVRSNLFAHHLLVLERAGLVEVLRSSGDRRRRYVRLHRPGLDDLTLPSPAVRPRSILFVCTGNSARSPLAAALWRACSDVPADSAGTHPAERVHPLAVAAGERRGLDLTAAMPRAMESVTVPDLLVTVCDEANEELGAGDVPLRLHWSIPDPAVAGDRQAFDQAISTLEARVEALRQVIAA
ncbi:MAG: helix-turn-helix domain-containing protein [Dehalococcoidia bacterium]|nr:helix-turn-helix domain-containing protein [Dehalococcoidia bacterium]